MKKKIIDKAFIKTFTYEITDIMYINGEIYLKITEQRKRNKWIKFSMVTNYHDEVRKYL